VKILTWKKRAEMVLNISILIVIALLVAPHVFYQSPSLLGGDRAYFVKSGSMFPTIRRGDIAIVKNDTKDLKIGEMVAFRADTSVFIHRLLGYKGSNLIVKGDASKTEDLEERVKSENVIGRVVYVIPNGFFYTWPGLLSFLFLPIYLLAVKGVRAVFQGITASKREVKRWRRKSFQPSIPDTTTLLLIIWIAVSLIKLISPTLLAGAYLTDKEGATGFFQVGEW
jgi:signal peptidase I